MPIVWLHEGGVRISVIYLSYHSYSVDIHILLKPLTSVCEVRR